MQKVLTAEQMREVDRLTTERYGIPSIILMENAAQAAALAMQTNAIKEAINFCIWKEAFISMIKQRPNSAPAPRLAPGFCKTGLRAATLESHKIFVPVQAV